MLSGTVAPVFRRGRFVIPLILVTGCAQSAFAVGVFAAPAQAAPPGPNGLIAFVATGSTALAIETISVDGGGRSAPLVTGRWPAWSPDGSRVTYGTTVKGISQIFVMNADGSLQTQLTHESASPGATDPAWSPDGKQLAFARTTTTFGTQIAVMNADGSGETGLTTPGTARDDRPNFSPDGKRILFDSTRVGNQEVWVMNADGSAPTQLTSTPNAGDGAFSAMPNWSPNGTRIAFETNRDTLDRNNSANGAEIYVMNADGSSPVRLTHDAISDERPVWSPDGTLIAYSHLTLTGPFNLGPVNLHVMNANGSQQHQIAAGATEPDWQPAPEPDSDGDALPDKWETDGVDVDGDGAVDLDLPAMGADPDHKDLFVEVDAMAGHELDQAAVDAVVQAFRDAPVTNPDRVDGIALHVDNGPGSVMDPTTGEPWGSLSQHDTLPHQDVLGNDVGGPYDWTAFDALKTSHFSLDRAPVFHYVIAAHQYGDAANTSSGISRGIGASDLIVSLLSCPEVPGGQICTARVEMQSGTLMHELGHNLGLRHGGGDDVNNKPVYLSIMNYDFQFTGLPKRDGTTVLDYSTFTLDSVDENAVNEGGGFGAPFGSLISGFDTVYTCGNKKVLAHTVLGVVDFDCSGFNDGVVAADINGDGDLTPLTATVDWPRLVFDGGGIGSLGAPAPPQTTPEIEPRLSELLAYRAAIEAGVGPSPPTRPVVTPPVTTPAPTTPGLVPAPPAQRPVTCTLRPSSSVALHGRKRGRLTLTVRCAAAATVRLHATVTTTATPRHGKRRRTKSTLRTVTVRARAGRNETTAIALPATVLRALARHQPTSVRLHLDGAGVRATTANVSRLRQRR